MHADRVVLGSLMLVTPTTPPTQLHASVLPALLERASHGDVNAFAAFYDHTIGDAHRYAVLRVVEPAAVEVLLRAAYLNAWLDSASANISGYSARAWLIVLLQLNATAELEPIDPVEPTC